MLHSNEEVCTWEKVENARKKEGSDRQTAAPQNKKTEKNEKIKEISSINLLIMFVRFVCRDVMRFFRRPISPNKINKFAKFIIWWF